METNKRRQVKRLEEFSFDTTLSEIDALRSNVLFAQIIDLCHSVKANVVEEFVNQPENLEDSALLRHQAKLKGELEVINFFIELLDEIQQGVEDEQVITNELKAINEDE